MNDQRIRAWIAPLSVVLVLLLGGCAGNQHAPVESRGEGTVAPPADAAALPDGEVPRAGVGVQVNPLPYRASPAAIEPDRDESVAPLAVPARPAVDSRSPGGGAPAVRRAPANPAVVALLNRANADAGAGRHGPAAASLERALKIEPGNAWLWHRLAVIRLEQGRAGEAASLAARSNALAGADNALRADNWRLIARVHRQRGEDVAARAAERRAQELMNPVS